MANAMIKLMNAGLERQAVQRDSPQDSHHIRRWLFFGSAFVVVALDQITKTMVRTFMERGDSWPDPDWILKLRYVTNSGAAFGILQDQTTFLIIMAFVGLIAIYLYYRFPPFEHPIAAAAIGLMLGGALGNLIDRIIHGRVTDFIDPQRFPAFNVADTAINIGIASILIGYFLFSHDKQEPEADQ